MRRKPPKRTLFRWLALCLAMSWTFPVNAYDDIPGSESSIRGAYFFGSRQGNLTSDFLARYAYWIPELKDGSCTSEVRLETPFLEVANYASQDSNHSAQDAVQRFYGKHMIFRAYLDISPASSRGQAPPSASQVLRSFDSTIYS
jgi:hypothetical protein